MEKEKTNSAKTNNHREKLSNKRSQRESEELLLRDILMEVEMGDEEYWREKTEQWANDPNRNPTPEQRAAFEERLELEVKRIQKQKREDALTRARRRHRTTTMMKRVAMVLLVVGIITGSALYNTVEAFAAGVDRFIATVLVDDGAEELRVEEKAGGELEFEATDFAGMYLPQWLPKGYFLVDAEIGTHVRTLRYRNDKGDSICFQIAKRNCSVIVDDEEVDEEQVYLRDTYGRIIVADTRMYVVWEEGDYLYTVSGKTELREDLIRVIEQSIMIETEN